MTVIPTDDYAGPERRKGPPLSKDDHAKICSASDRKLNERFVHIYGRFEEGTERMIRIEESLADIAKSGQDNREQIEHMARRMDKIDTNLDRNTEVTREVKDILDTAKGAFKFFGFFGTVLKWALGLGASVLAFWVALKDFRVH